MKKLLGIVVLVLTSCTTIQPIDNTKWNCQKLSGKDYKCLKTMANGDNFFSVEFVGEAKENKPDGYGKIRISDYDFNFSKVPNFEIIFTGIYQNFIIDFRTVKFSSAYEKTRFLSVDKCFVRFPDFLLVEFQRNLFLKHPPELVRLLLENHNKRNHLSWSKNLLI